MTPSKDNQADALSKDILQALDNLNGVHPGFRPAHAKGILLSGMFTPSPGAVSLTRAPHAQRTSTPVTVRFSDFAGFPTVADNDPQNASPRGIAIRFLLAEHVHTDIIGHSVDGFAVRTAEDFVEFLKAAGASGPGVAHPTPIEAFLGAHPKALQFLQTPKPTPVSFATESFFSVTAYKFVNGSGTSQFGRYRIRPEAGNQHLDDAAAAAKGANFLFDEITARIAKEPVRFQVLVQIAGAGDVVDDATAHWPDNRTEVEFGSITLTGPVPDDAAQQRHIIFDPIPRVDGIESSGDPLLEPRAAVYLMSGRRRREG
jgi:catalase